MSAKIFGERWEIIKSLPEGGQGFIYLVRDLEKKDSNTYVLKLLKKSDRKDRFEREIEAIKNIDSPYITKVIDTSKTEDKDYYFVMPYIETTLDDILPQLKADFLRSLKIFKKICLGAESAHKNEPQIVHRDLKPLNILIDEKDDPYIIDFGICHLDKPERFTMSKEQVGSRYYIAPECENGKSEEIGPHTDIYSLGKVLYAMISGGKIFSRERQNEDEFNLEKKLDNKRTKFITEIINKCVQKDINKRYTNVGNLIASVDEKIGLIEDGFYPLNYGNEFCRFCGKGKLEKFGQLRGAILERRGQEDILSYEMFIWGCPECGIAYIFKDNLYNPKKDWIP